MEEILEKMRKYCVFQDRSAMEVKLKLKPYKLTQPQIDDIIESLKKDNFINEERFIKNFIQGKMNARQWGKIKIKNELLWKGINENIINAYIEEIEEDHYLENLNSSIEKWLRTNQLNRETYPKLYRHLLSKGFESNIISSGIKNYCNKELQ